MKSQFFLVRTNSSDSEPEPQPTPIPIRLVKDKKSNVDIPPPPNLGKKDDRFYPSWDAFLQIEPKRGKKQSSIAKGIKQEQDQLELQPEGIEIREWAATSYEEAAAACKAKVAAIVEECERLNQKYRDAAFDLEASADCLRSLSGRFVEAFASLGVPPWVKRTSDLYEEPQFFNESADAADVHQGFGGDCWFLAALMSVSAKPDLINKLCVARNEKAGVYGFVFFRDGEWISEVVDDKLYLKVGDDDVLDVVRDWNREKRFGTALRFDEDKLKLQLQKGGEALYFSRGSKNETWVPLIEKAYAKAHGDYCAIEGGFASEGAEDLTGGVATVIMCEDIMDKDRFWDDLRKVNEQYLFGCGGLSSDKKGFVSGHAYAILQAYEDKEKGLRLLKMRNPWGEFEWNGEWSDGSKMWCGEMMTKLGHTFGDDGIFWISYEDVLKHFPAINRVRLFDESWAVAGCWTSVAVPWTTDYLDDSFKFTTSEAGPVVIVLQQPDDRYFMGLKGRYYHSLHFRVYKDKREEKYIVRSLHNSGNFRHDTRSVSAEIDGLEPGTYEVIFKITTQRREEDLTIAEVIQNCAKDRKDKLLEVGRRYDFAATKGNLRKAELDQRSVVRSNKLGLRKEEMKRRRGHLQKQKEQDKKKKDRIDKAKRERKAIKKTAKDVHGKDESKEQDKAALTPATSTTSSTQEDQFPKQENTTAGETGNGGQSHSHPRFVTTTDAKQIVSEQIKEPDSSEERTETEDVPRAEKDGTKEEVEGDSKDVDGRHSPDPNHEHREDDTEESISDGDFSWNSDIDDPVYLTSDDDGDSNTYPGLFGNDVWSAMCVVGLRVYAQGAPPKVWVVKSAMS